MLKIEDSGPLIIFSYYVPAYNPKAIGYDKFNYNSNLTYDELLRELNAFTIEYGDLGVYNYNLIVESNGGEIIRDNKLMISLRAENYVFKDIVRNLNDNLNEIVDNYHRPAYVLRAIFSLIKPMKYAYINKRKSKKNKRRKRTNVPKGLRHEVFKRDGYRCVECGARVDDGATLHIDHIIPVSKGGSNELDNLQTLCSDCNLNKSDLYQKPRNR